ncbi:MAG: hypothetical protein NZV14_18315 [Bryobacteraceae bacterium]|nr:hypothetical protein [Bryobacteraceae bacterium]MDW8380121.1 hypothetical protein [Bryobacterales bacterium]
MNRIFSTTLLLLLATWLAFAGVDGRWVAEVKQPERKEKRGRDTLTTVFEFKTDGNKLTGTVSAGGRKAAAMEITDGKVEGNTITFKTVQKSRRKGDIEIEWRGTLEGDQLKLSRTMKNGRRSQELVAKRQ